MRRQAVARSRWINVLWSVGAFLFWSPDLAAQSPPPRDSLVVAAAINTFHSAMARGDSTLVLSLFQPDATIIRGGVALSLRDFRSSLLREEIERTRTVPGIALPSRITVRGNVAWAVTTTRREGTTQGKRVREIVAELVILSRSFQGWRINVIQWSSTQAGNTP